MTKKVLLLIVEGITDKTTLGLILTKLLSSENVHFEITNGDLTVENNICVQNAIQTVNNCVKMFLSKNRFKRSDLIKIIHLIDTDGAFIPSDKVCSSTIAGTHYYLDKIETANLEKTLRRIRKKSAVVKKLSSTPQIASTPYCVYYFSRNLEHVLHNRQEDLNKEEKFDLAEKFEDAYVNSPNEFIKFLKSKDFCVDGSYEETWAYIMSEVNSLKRKCNFHLFFE